MLYAQFRAIFLHLLFLILIVDNVKALQKLMRFQPVLHTLDLILFSFMHPIYLSKLKPSQLVGPSSATALLLIMSHMQTLLEDQNQMQVHVTEEYNHQLAFMQLYHMRNLQLVRSFDEENKLAGLSSVMTISALIIFQLCT